MAEKAFAIVEWRSKDVDLDHVSRRELYLFAER
jgi:hypothetical protein